LLRKLEGYKVVLTADRTLMADYSLLFDGMLAASQTTTAPPGLVGPLVMPRARGDSVRARVAPMGLRRIEAALAAGGFGPEDVAVVDCAHLRDAIGPATRIVGVSSGEPAGLGMNTSTMTAIAGGRIYPEVMFRKLMKEVRRLVGGRAPSAKVVLGGPGAWQLAGDGSHRDMGVDHVVTGYAEGNIAAIFDGILRGEPTPQVIQGQGPPAAEIPRIRAAGTMGVVEISRGCGLGCSFCTIARIPMIHLPEETIIADVKTNVAAGKGNIAALSEDLFRYGASGQAVDPLAVISLLRLIREVEGLRLIQIDHANILSASRFSDDELQAVRELLVGPTGCRYPWVNIGVETAAGRLLQTNGGGAKMGDRPPDDWGAFCAEQLRRLCRAGFFPMVSLLIGLPGESEEDVRASLAWVEALRDERISIFPMLYAPVDGGPAPDPRDLGSLHWRLIKACYRLNFRWVPRMYWDNQTAAGVGLPWRCLLQALGQCQAFQWKALLAWRSFNAKHKMQNTQCKIPEPVIK